MKFRFLSLLEKRKGIFKVLAITVAFNNSEVISAQIGHFFEHASDRHDFKLVVVDNSSSPSCAGSIKDICNKKNIDYYRVPKNPYTGLDPSKSHGYALNWASRKVAHRYQSEWFGFLDHDIFLLGSLKDFLANLTSTRVAYGVVNTKNEKWYFWPGFCFFKRSNIDARKLDFMPVPGLDTGGANWSVFYKDMDPSSYGVAKLRTIYPKNSKEKNKQRDAYEIVDNLWMHLINASNWAGVDMQNKQQKLDTLVEKLTKDGEREENH